jgi:hypothetical protein
VIVTAGTVPLGKTLQLKVKSTRITTVEEGLTFETRRTVPEVVDIFTVAEPLFAQSGSVGAWEQRFKEAFGTNDGLEVKVINN